jgi:hypothetical protein
VRAHTYTQTLTTANCHSTPTSPISNWHEFKSSILIQRTQKICTLFPHTHTHTHTHIHMYRHMHAYTPHTKTLTHAQYTPAQHLHYMHTNTHTRAHIHISETKHSLWAWSHTYTHTHTHTHAHIHTHTNPITHIEVKHTYHNTMRKWDTLEQNHTASINMSFTLFNEMGIF